MFLWEGDVLRYCWQTPQALESGIITHSLVIKSTHDMNGRVRAYVYADERAVVRFLYVD